MVLHNGFTLIIDNVLITAEHSPVVKIIKVSQYKEKNQYNWEIVLTNNLWDSKWSHVRFAKLSHSKNSSYFNSVLGMTKTMKDWLIKAEKQSL